jgi:CRISPR-associated protein Csc2
MQVYEIPVLKSYNQYFQPEISEFRECKYIQIVILRETKSYNLFTIDGENLHVERTPAGIENLNLIDRVVMYKNKQAFPERLTGRALLRQFGLCPSQTIKAVSIKPECKINTRACVVCPDCMLYGFTPVSKEESDICQPRVMTDSGFVVRNLNQVSRNINLSTINDITTDNILPEVFIPAVETLVDVTIEEFVYVIGNILKTTRYGIDAGCEGFIRNHIMGVYFSDVEVFSNLEMSQFFYDKISINGSIPDNLTLQNFIHNFVPVANECIKQSIGCITMLTDEEISELIHDISVIYSDQRYLSDFLKSLTEICSYFIHQHNLI